MADTLILKTGRRKEAVATVKLKAGTGKIVVNGRPMEDYFPRLSLQAMILQPLKATQTMGKLDCTVRVVGGGLAGQAGAIRHGLSRALTASDEGLKSVLRTNGFLTRDPRARERKKYGQKGARKRFQWTKR